MLASPETHTHTLSQAGGGRAAGGQCACGGRTLRPAAEDMILGRGGLDVHAAEAALVTRLERVQRPVVLEPALGEPAQRAARPRQLVLLGKVAGARHRIELVRVDDGGDGARPAPARA
eukprot:4790941-Prymnesium_polylepis.2